MLDFLGRTALHHTASGRSLTDSFKNKPKVALLLLETRALLETQDSHGCTARDRAEADGGHEFFMQGAQFAQQHELKCPQVDVPSRLGFIGQSSQSGTSNFEDGQLVHFVSRSSWSLWPRSTCGNIMSLFSRRRR